MDCVLIHRQSLSRVSQEDILRDKLMHPCGQRTDLRNDCACVTCVLVCAKISTWLTNSERKTLDFAARTPDLAVKFRFVFRCGTVEFWSVFGESLKLIWSTWVLSVVKQHFRHFNYVGMVSPPVFIPSLPLRIRHRRNRFAALSPRHGRRIWPCSQRIRTLLM